jgi:eukaryotic-like serine/threonine-protein kinase
MLRSPHVVQVFDFNHENPDEPYLVMELLRGETLHAVLMREKRLSEHRTVAIALQLLSVLAEVHRNGIVHRDVKPSNLQLLPDPHLGEQLKLLDFGVAKLAQASRALTRDGFIVGTASYMPPEQLLTGELDGRSDLYAVGAVLFECLVGTRLSLANTVPGVIRDAELRPERLALSELAALSPKLFPLVQKALAKSPSNRFASATEMREALLKADVRTPGAPMHAQKYASASKTKTYTLAIAFVSAAALGLFAVASSIARPWACATPAHETLAPIAFTPPMFHEPPPMTLATASADQRKPTVGDPTAVARKDAGRLPPLEGTSDAKRIGTPCSASGSFNPSHPMTCINGRWGCGEGAMKGTAALCNGRCVNIMSGDSQNCGRCGNRCPGEGATCGSSGKGDGVSGVCREKQN